MQGGGSRLPRKVIAGTEIVIAGAGVIGLALALELHSRGWRVTVFESGQALAAASSAAAGMLAADDPHNPPGLLPLSRYSIANYTTFLERVQHLSGLAVPFQTEWTVQHQEDGSSKRIAEHSLDPRQLAHAVRRAIDATSIELHEQHPLDVRNLPHGAHTLVHATGAWFDGSSGVFPRKGQMLRVQLPHDFTLSEVHRSESIYIVPRTLGRAAGTAVIGATVEDAGYDLTTHAIDLQHLRQLAAEFVPEIASEHHAPSVEAWAGTRPATHDGLPLLGALTPAENPAGVRQFVATGHFRNGILLAPATALVMADLIEGRRPDVELGPYSPER